MSQYILTVDQGTTSSRAIIYTPDLQVIASGQEEFKQHYPNNGWVEHEPDDIWQTVLRSCRKAMVKAGASASDVQGIGITNQRETTLVWDKYTGEPVCRAIVWQDRRTADICRSLETQGFASVFHQSTGLRLDPYFSGTKLKWILDNVEGARERAKNGDLLFGTVDTFLLWRFSKGQVHATDATNAARTLMFNIHSQEWDQKLLDILGVPERMLPEVKDNAADFGQCDAEWLGRDIPICSMIGDQHSALVGQACFQPGMIKSTYGTGCFAVLNTGDQIRVSDHNLLTTVGYRLQGKTTYALEGSIFMAGAIIQWLRDGLGLIERASDVEQLTESVPYDQSEIMVPAFTGLGAPYWDPNARAAIFGMTRDTGAKQLVAAAIHSVALQSADLLRAMERDGVEVNTLRVDGGMVKNRGFLQALASITGVETVTSNTAEATAQGATMLAAMQLGHYDSLDALAQLWQAKEHYQPRLKAAERDALYQRWQRAVAKVRSEASG